MQVKKSLIFNFKNAGIHFYFGNIGVSMIWGMGSYSDNHGSIQYIDSNGKEQVLQVGDTGYFTKAFELQGIYCENVEIYPIGEWPQGLHDRLLKHFKEESYPIGYVPVAEIPYVLNMVKRFAKITTK